MARTRVGLKGCNQRKIQQRDEDTDESDEEYKVTDEDFDESDECYSIDGDESENISADFEKQTRVSRSRHSRKTSGKKVNENKKSRKRRRVTYTEDDNDNEVADEDDAEFLSLNREANHTNKPMEKKRVSYTEVNDDDGEDYKEFVFSGRNRKQRKNPREKKKVSYTEVNDDDDDDDDDEYDHGGDDDDDDDDDDDEDYKEFMFSGRNRKQRKNPREKKRVVHKEDEDDDAVEEEDVDEDDVEFMSSDREANWVNKPMERKRDSYTEVDDDDGDGDDYKENVFLGRSRKHRKKPLENKRVVYTDDDDDDDDDDDGDDKGDGDEEEEVPDEDDAAFMSSGRKANQIKTPTAMWRDSSTEKDDDGVAAADDEEEEEEVEKEEEEEEEEEEEKDDEYTEFVSSSRNRNQRKKPQEKKVVYTEDDEDEDEDEDDTNDDEYMYSGRKVNQKKNLWGKSEVSCTDDDDDSGFISASRKRNQISKRRQKRIVSYKEDNQEEEDESDAEFKLSESDFVDDEDETPKIKKNKARSHPEKKSVQGGRKKSKRSKPKNPTKPKRRKLRSGQKLGSSKEKSVANKTKMENQSKISKRRNRRADWQRAMVDSDSDFVSSASSDHEYTISEEEREQLREARVYCANLRAKLRSSSCANQEKQPTYEQKKYPIRKGKEKIEDVKDDIGKQVCGICLSEEQKRTLRGVLNCCRHYFCFACIMEWSKVESRCPLCKQRFTTITKAAKSDTGFDLRTVVIPVPECDQVYEPSEEELRGYLDPYENVICTECQNGGDDALMLLCDICDSSAHTFCVGLGQEVPEGNWYCDGCRPTVFGTLNPERRLSNNASDLSSPSPIPGGFDLNELYVPETPLTQQTRAHPEPNTASTGTGATTLRDRRRLHRQIHNLGLLSNNRMNDLVGRSSRASASSSGIRLFGSQLDEARNSVSQNDNIFSSMQDPSNFYPRTDQFSAQAQNSNLPSGDLALQDEHVTLPAFIGIHTDPPVH